MRSTKRVTSAFPVWARCTSREIPAKTVSFPTAVARSVNTPSIKTVAPITWSPGETKTGIDSPVINALST